MRIVNIGQAITGTAALFALTVLAGWAVLGIISMVLA